MKKEVIRNIGDTIYIAIELYIKVGIILMILWIMLKDFSYLIDRSWIIFWSFIGLYWLIYPLFRKEERGK